MVEEALVRAERESTLRYNFRVIRRVDVRHTCFFFNATATTEIYTLSLHDALPISARAPAPPPPPRGPPRPAARTSRSEEHTSELQSRLHLVCRLLLEKKKIKAYKSTLLPPLI